MKYLFYFFVLLNIMALQPYDKQYSSCDIVAFYYKGGKLVTSNNFGDHSIQTGTGISSTRYFVNGKQIKVDSIVFKIR